MTTQETIARIQNANPSGWKDLEELAEGSTITHDELSQRFTEIVGRDYMQSFGEPERTFHASAILHSELIAALSARAEEYQVHVIAVNPPAQRGKSRVAELYGIGHKIGASTQNAFIEATFFNENADKIVGAEVGRTYRVWLGSQNRDGAFKGGTFRLSGTARTSFSTVVDAPAPNVAEFLTTAFRVVPLAEAEKFISKNYELRLVQGEVMFSRTGVGKKSGRAYGQISIYDRSQTPKEWAAKGGGFGIMADATQAQLGLGSKVLVLGHITKNEQYGVGMNAKAVITVFKVPPKTAPQPKEQPAAAQAVTDGEAVNFDDFE